MVTSSINLLSVVWSKCMWASICVLCSSETSWEEKTNHLNKNVALGASGNVFQRLWRKCSLFLYSVQLKAQPIPESAAVFLHCFGGLWGLGIWNAYSDVSLAPCRSFPICQGREVIFRACLYCKNTRVALSVSWPAGWMRCCAFCGLKQDHVWVNKEESCLDVIKTVIKIFVHQTVGRACRGTLRVWVCSWFRVPLGFAEQQEMCVWPSLTTRVQAGHALSPLICKPSEVFL